MKKKLVIILGTLTLGFFQAQEVNEITYLLNKNSVDAFHFTQSTCNKNIINDAWKNFIKENKGKIGGDLTAKISGTHLQFNSENLWDAGIFYTIEKNNPNIEVYMYFKNAEGNFLSTSNSPQDIEIVKSKLQKFSNTVNLNCTTSDLKTSLSVKDNLTKELNNNNAKIKNLTKENAKIQNDLKKDYTASDITKKDFNKIQKQKNKQSSNELQIQNLQNRNIEIEQELNTKSQDITDIQNKLKDIRN
ncbi:hypothetical protein [Apibacter sp. HY039]|uniref:hypothetical protein n=1 Tax=Apibacter sp. HY039 TaxID=2501476 RepID=UPI000FEC06F0|nr:hypothetical protein [Apibacter sp. HY039]